MDRASIDAGVALAGPFIARWEGLVLTPYLCSAGVPTIGIGSTRYLDGRPVRLSDPPISREAAERLFALTTQRNYLPALLMLCPGIDTPRRLCALLSWTYNLGAGNLRASTLRRRINAGEWDRVPAELRKWVRAGGREVRGLVRRREAEAALV